MNKIIPVVLATAGALLLWAAINDKNPVDALKVALTGGKLSDIPDLGKD